MKAILSFILKTRSRSLALIILAAGLAYANTLDNAFHYDDRHSIQENYHIRDLSNVLEFFIDPTMFSRDAEKAMYRPVLLTTLALNHAWAGYRVGPYRVVNIGLHILCSGLVWLVLVAFRQSPCMSLFGGLFFAVHPLASEPVNYISSRSELLATCGVLASFWCYLRAGERGAYRWVIASTVCFAVGLWSKSMAISLPLLLLWSDYVRGHTDVRRAVRMLPYGMVVLLWMTLVHSFVVRAMFSEPVRSLAEQVGTQAKAVIFYALLFVVPTHQSVHHAFVEDHLVSPVSLLSFFLVASFLVAAKRITQRSSVVFFGLGWVFLTSLPTLVVPLNVLVNEHRLYLPLVGVSIMISGLATGRRVAGMLCWAPLLLGILGITTVLRNTDWRTEYTLWSQALARAPNEVRAHVYTGNAAKAAGRYGEAAERFKAALTLDPDNVVAWNNFGNLYEAQQAYRQACDVYGHLLGMRPELADVRYNYARALQLDGRAEEAIKQYRLIPSDGFHYHLTLNNVGTLLYHQGKRDSALVYFGRALGHMPGFTDALRHFNKVAMGLHSDGLFGVLEASCRQILEDVGQVREACYWHGLSLCGQRRYSACIVELQELVAAFPGFAEGYLELGNALETSGRLEEARAIYGRMLQENLESGLLAEGRRRLLRLVDVIGP